MARGNQRDLARAKNQKKQAEANKGRKDDGLTASQRAERDANIMREKLKKKEAQKQADQAAGKSDNKKKSNVY